MRIFLASTQGVGQFGPLIPFIDACTRSGQRPDLVVRESSEFASAIAADLHGVRQVRVAVGFSQVEDAALAIAAPMLDERRPGITARIADVLAPSGGLRACLELALRNGSYRDASRRISGEMRALPPVHRFLDAVTAESG